MEVRTMQNAKYATAVPLALALSLIGGPAVALEREQPRDYDWGFKRGWEAAFEEGGLVSPAVPDWRELTGAVTSGARPDFEQGYADGLHFGWERREKDRR
jgi:hypothetical protein